ncbi:hypothetical protein D3C87_1699980 [compost metagenome]
MLRNCPEAPATIACVNNGYLSRTSGWLAVSLLVASAPMDRPERVRWISRSGSRVMSTSRVGRSMSSFIRSSRLLPPARYRAWGMADTAAVAAAGSAARTYSNGLMAVLLHRA